MKTPDQRALPPPPHELLRRASLFLDLDGTLIEIASRPDAVKVDDSLRHLLTGVQHSLGGRVVIVSGRPAAEVRRLLRETQLLIAGSHGAEIELPDGTRKAPPPIAAPARVVARLSQLASLHPGVLVEHKPFGFAIHYRLAPQAEHDCRVLAESIAASEEYSLQPGKKVIEVKYHPITKGDAVKNLMREAPMKEGRPLFIGDDQTDEAGFAAAVGQGGAGILVGPQRMTHASYRLESVADALRWLEAAAECVL